MHRSDVRYGWKAGINPESGLRSLHTTSRVVTLEGGNASGRLLIIGEQHRLAVPGLAHDLPHHVMPSLCSAFETFVRLRPAG